MLNSDQGYKALRQSAGVYWRDAKAVRVTGRDHVPAVTWALAKTIEFAEPGHVVESLVLNDGGVAVGSAIAFLNDDEALVLDEADGSLPAALASSVSVNDLEDVQITEESGATRVVAVEGPLAWKVIDGILPDEHVSELLLNEWREGSISDINVGLARIGVTAEYGYLLVVASSDADAVFASLEKRAKAVGGGAVSAEPVLRAKIEANHFCGVEQSRGLGIFEAGIAWLTTLEREDDYRGKASIDRAAPQKRIVAAVANQADFPAQDTVVTLFGEKVGWVQVAAPACGIETGVGLLVLDVPFDVPGVELVVGGVTLQTVSRPTIDPASWVIGLGESQ